MEGVTDLLNVTPSIAQLSRIITNVAAPAFLLGAVGSFISILVSRMNRVIDRCQLINGISPDDTSRAYLKQDLPRLRRRASLLNRSLHCAILSAILTALIIIIAFVSALLSFAHEYGAAILFISAMLTFGASLIDLARETRIALAETDLCS